MVLRNACRLTTMATLSNPALQAARNLALRILLGVPAVRAANGWEKAERYLQRCAPTVCTKSKGSPSTNLAMGAQTCSRQRPSAVERDSDSCRRRQRAQSQHTASHCRTAVFDPTRPRPPDLPQPTDVLQGFRPADFGRLPLFLGGATSGVDHSKACRRDQGRSLARSLHPQRTALGEQAGDLIQVGREDRVLGMVPGPARGWRQLVAARCVVQRFLHALARLDALDPDDCPITFRSISLPFTSMGVASCMCTHARESCITEAQPWGEGWTVGGISLAKFGVDRRAMEKIDRRSEDCAFQGA